MTVKRRVIWMSDEDWTRIQATAAGRGFTISEYLRRLTNGHDLSTSTWSAVKAERRGGTIELAGQLGEPVVHRTFDAPPPLRQEPTVIDPDRPFNSHPFTPVPKSGKH